MPRSFTGWLNDRIEESTKRKDKLVGDTISKSYYRGMITGFEKTLEAFEKWSKNELEDD